jgi:hypothetical protein
MSQITPNRNSLDDVSRYLLPPAVKRRRSRLRMPGQALHTIVHQEMLCRNTSISDGEPHPARTDGPSLAISPSPVTCPRSAGHRAPLSTPGVAPPPHPARFGGRRTERKGIHARPCRLAAVVPAGLSRGRCAPASQSWHPCQPARGRLGRGSGRRVTRRPAESAGELARRDLVNVIGPRLKPMPRPDRGSGRGCTPS